MYGLGCIDEPFRHHHLLCRACAATTAIAGHTGHYFDCERKET